MIEFTGYITGAAEKCFMRKSRKIGLSFVAVAILFSLPATFYIGKVILRDNAFIYAMLGGLCILLLLCFIPKGKKEHFALLPKRIYADKTHIVCVADRYTDSKLISDVTKVIDHGEYYELCFPFGKVSEKFICQKNLLTSGSLKEFEALFEGKVIRM